MTHNTVSGSYTTGETGTEEAHAYAGEAIERARNVREAQLQEGMLQHEENLAHTKAEGTASGGAQDSTASKEVRETTTFTKGPSDTTRGLTADEYPGTGMSKATGGSGMTSGATAGTGSPSGDVAHKTHTGDATRGDYTQPATHNTVAGPYTTGETGSKEAHEFATSAMDRARHVR
jgi:hypothetical protein